MANDSVGGSGEGGQEALSSPAFESADVDDIFERASPSAGEDERAVTGTVGGILFLAGIWLVLVLMLMGTADFRPAARVVPRIAAIPSIIVATVLLAKETVALAKRWRSRGAVPAPASVRDEIAAFLWLTAYSIGVFAVGFAIASVGFMLAFLRSYGEQSWRQVILKTVVVVGIIVVVFDGLLGLRVYEGLLFG